MWRLQSATSYLREGDTAQADTAFRAVAAQAHKDDLAVPEAEAWRMMAVYQSNHASAMELLNKAEAVLAEKHPLPKSAQQQELALVLRDRAIRAAEAGNNALAEAVLKKLRDMAGAGHDQIIQIASSAAIGAVLVKQSRYNEAIPYLEEDDRNPLSLRTLVLARQKTGAQAQADDLAKLLANWNEPTLEQALVTPQFRAKQKGAVAVQ